MKNRTDTTPAPLDRVVRRKLRVYACRTNPSILLSPCLVFEDVSMGRGRWKLYVGWLRFEVGISWNCVWP